MDSITHGWQQRKESHDGRHAAFLVATGVLLAFALLALGYGVDSRDGIGDDHVRSSFG